MAEAGAVVHIIRAEDGSGQLLEQIVLFVRGLGRGGHADGIGAVARGNLAEPRGNQFEGLLPGGLPEPAPLPDQRHCQPIRAMNELKAESPFCAETAPVGRPVEVRPDHNHLAILDVQIQLAATPTIGADRCDRPMRPNPFIPGGNLFSKGACRAIGDALTTRDAGRFAQRLTIVGDHDASVSTLRDSQDMMALDLAAGPNAPPTENTSIEIHSDERVRVVDRKGRPFSGEAPAGKIMAFGEGMQLAPTSPLGL